MEGRARGSDGNIATEAASTGRATIARAGAPPALVLETTPRANYAAAARHSGRLWAGRRDLGRGLALFFGLKALGVLRVSEAGELEGLDIHEHGSPAYHMEFGYGMSYTTPTGGAPFGGVSTKTSALESESVST